VHFNVWLKTNSRQWIFAGDIDAKLKGAIRDGAERKRINLLEWEAMVDHMRLRIGGQDAGNISRIKHLLTGASARLTLRAAPDIQFNAGLSHFWQKRQGQTASGREV